MDEEAVKVAQPQPRDAEGLQRACSQWAAPEPHLDSLDSLEPPAPHVERPLALGPRE